MFQNLTEGCDSIVFGVIVLSLFALLFLCGRIHLEFDGVFKTYEAYIFDSTESWSAVLGDHTNAINGSLSDGRVLRIGIRADLIANLRINWAEEIGTKIFDHVVEDEEEELLLLLGGVLFDQRNDVNQELLHQILNMQFVGLEEDTENFSKTELKFILVFVFFLEHEDILFVELVFLFTLLVLLFVLLIILDSVLRLLDEPEDLIGELVDTLWLKKVVTGFLNDFFDGLGLSDQAFCLGFRVHGRDNIITVQFGHGVKFLRVSSRGFGTLDETCKCSSGGVSDVVASIVLGKSEENTRYLFDVLSEPSTKLVNEDNEHLNGGILLLNFIGHNVGLFLAFVWLHFLNDVGHVTSSFSFDTHLWFERGTCKNWRKDFSEVWGELFLHDETDSLPS